MKKQSEQTVTQILQGAIDLLSRRGGWTKKASARDKFGEEIEFADERATCFCAYGAIRRAGVAHRNNTWDAMEALENQIGTGMIGDWNDRQKTKRTVIKALQKSLETVEGKP